jgi:hypothetical protein
MNITRYLMLYEGTQRCTVLMAYLCMHGILSMYDLPFRVMCQESAGTAVNRRLRPSPSSAILLHWARLGLKVVVSTNEIWPSTRRS